MNFSCSHMFFIPICGPDHLSMPISPLNAEFRRRETRFLALQARRAAMAGRLPRWLRWLLPPFSRARHW